MPHCLPVSLLQAVHWCLRKEGEKEDRESCVCDLILLFSPLLVIHYSFCKVFSWRALLTFQEYRVGPSGGHFRELFVCGCLRLSVREKRE